MRKTIKLMILMFCIGILSLSSNVKASEIDKFTYNGEEYKYTTSNYIQTQEEADKLIEQYGTNIVKPLVDVAPTGYPYFVGYNNASHKAIYSDKEHSLERVTRASVNGTIKASGTWRLGSYWGTVMTDSNGDYYYCLDFGKNYPIGNQNFSREEHTATLKGLSYGFPFVKSGSNTNNAQYGKTTSATWRGRGYSSGIASQSTIGSVYWKVYQGYKGQIKENKATFTIGGSASTSQKDYPGIPNQNVTGAITISTTAKFGIQKVEYDKLTAINASAYIYHKVNKKWYLMSSNTFYSGQSYTHIRIATKDMSSNKKIPIIDVITDINETAGYMYDNGKSGDQRIAKYDRLTTFERGEFQGQFKQQTVNIKGLKLMNDLDLYENEIENYYSTKDGKKVTYVTELGTNSESSLLRYAKKDEFIEKDLYNKPYEYEYLDYTHITEIKDKLDENGQKIAVDDENGNKQLIDDGAGNMINNPLWTPTYEQETVNVLDENGVPKVKAKKIGEEYVYAKATTSFNMPSKDVMDNLYKPNTADNVEFTLLKADKKTVIKTVIVNNGDFTFTGLLPGTYYVKETKTKENFNLVTTIYEVKATTAGATYTINNGKAVINEINYSEIYVSKKAVTNGPELEGANMQFLDEDMNVVDEWVSNGGDSHLVKVPKGNYFIKETASPKGYAIFDKLIPVIIDENGQVMHIEVINELIKNDINIGKIDVTDGDLLKGATLCFLNEDLTEYKSEYGEKTCHVSNGKDDYKYKNVPYGNYFIKETASPKGYDKLDKLIPVIIDEQGKVQKIKVSNKPTKIIKTGGLLLDNNMINNVKNLFKQRDYNNAY